MRFPKLSGLLLTLATLTSAGCSDQEEKQESKLDLAESRRRAVISYLGNPRFSGEELLRQITGTEAEMRMHDLSEGMLYFTIPEKAYSKQATAEIVVDPTKVEFGKTQDGKFSGPRLELGSLVLRKPGHYFFRTPATNLRVDEEDNISLNFGNVTYTQTMDELAGFIFNRSIYGGLLNVDIGSNRRGSRIVTSNHGALIATRGEPSLTKLVSQIVPEGSSPEVAAQKLLDFVTDNMQYNYSEAYSQAETLKRPNEVLMSGGSDCSGLTILYASLLEQIGIDYRLVYGENHINVAVAGNFGSKNGMRFRLGETDYTFAEPTTKGFVIGKTMLTETMDHNSVKQYQKPGKDAPVIDGKTGQPRPFR